MALSYVLFGWVLTAGTAISAGALLFHFLKLRFAWPMAFVLGACPLSLIVTLLGFCGLIQKGVFLALSVIVIGACIRLRAYRTIDSLQISEKWFWLGFAPFTVAYLSNAMAPEMSPDGMAYHLALVNRYYRAHALIPVPDNMYANLSQGIEMLFLFAYAFGKYSAAALIHCTYLFALPLMIADFATRKGWAVAGAFAGLFVYATPVVGIDGVSAYNDVAIACLWFALLIITDRFETNRVIPAGMLVGFAYAVKYTAVVTVLFLFWRWRKHWRALAASSGVAALFILPWVLKNWIWIGNPLAPLFNAWFPNASMTASFEIAYKKILRTYYITSIPEWIENVFLHGEKLGGFLGPMWVLAPLGFLQPGWVFAALIYPMNIGARFLIPLLPFLALGIGKTLGRWRVVAIAICAVHLYLSWPTVTKTYANSWRIEHIPWKPALRIVPEEKYLGDNQGYRVARMIETFVPKGERVFSFTSQGESYTTRELLTGYYSTKSQNVTAILQTPLLSAWLPTWRHEIKLAAPRRTIRIEQTVTASPETWKISEIEPRPARIRSSASPFYLELAVDGNPVTRWDSGLSLRPMWVEVEYDRDVSEITVWMSHDQGAPILRVENAQITVQDRQKASPWPDLRRWATETVRGMGYRYLVIDESNFGYKDYLERAADWNLEIVASRGGSTLIRIK